MTFEVEITQTNPTSTLDEESCSKVIYKQVFDDKDAEFFKKVILMLNEGKELK